MLKNLHELANNTLINYQENFVNEDFELSREFKDRFAEVIEEKGISVEFLEYSVEITTQAGMKIFCANQWFYLATFVVEYLRELIKYKEIIEELSETHGGSGRKQFLEKIKNLKGSLDIEDEPGVKERIYNYFSGSENEKDIEYLTTFITNYEWWYGSKTIDRGDYFVSPVLRLLGVVNVSQGYIADIAFYMASEDNLLSSALKMREQEFRKTSTVKGENLIVYGAPGTGKSKYLEDNFLDATRVVFHSDYSYYDFVGTYKPVPVYKESNITLRNLQGEKIISGEPIIDYRFVGGPFINVLKEAALNPEKNFTLLIEEINRANAASVFGDIFQLLDRKPDGESRYKILPGEDLHNHLSSHEKLNEIFKRGLFIPRNMSIVATMNSADQGVYVLDSAFKRRWKFKYMPIKEAGFVHENVLIDYAGEKFKWKFILQEINRKLRGLRIEEDKLIGPYFLSPEEISETENITSKLLIYLWDDVIKYKRDSFFDSEVQTFSDLTAKFNTGYDILLIKTELEAHTSKEEDLQNVEYDLE